MRPKTGILIAFVMLLALFLIQNRQPMTIEFLFFETRISGSLFIFVAALVSFVVGFIIGRITEDDDNDKQKAKDIPPLSQA